MTADGGMTGPAARVRPASRADLPELTRVLAAAFYDDPPFVWLLPDEASRPARLRRFFGALLRAEVQGLETVDAAVDARSGRIVGAAVWFAPGRYPPSALRQVRAAPGYVRALGRRSGPATELVAAMNRVHPRLPYWYLHMIGVDPARQGQGAGSALLRSRLEHVDQAGAAAFLESSKWKNVPLYERFGFRSQDVPPLPAGAPPMIPMSRPARAAAVSS